MHVGTTLASERWWIAENFYFFYPAIVEARLSNPEFQISVGI
jgi:hypothetical protein